MISHITFTLFSVTGTLDSATTSDNDDTDEINTTPPPSITSVPGHFSKSPSERQNMLMQRREILLKQARERYLKTNQDRKTKEQQAAAAANSSSDGEFPLANFNTNDRHDDIDSISPSTHFPPVTALPLQNFLQRRSFSSESGSNDDDDDQDDDDDIDQVFDSDTDDSNFSDDSII